MADNKTQIIQAVEKPGEGRFQGGITLRPQPYQDTGSTGQKGVTLRPQPYQDSANNGKQDQNDRQQQSGNQSLDESGKK